MKHITITLTALAVSAFAPVALATGGPTGTWKTKLSRTNASHIGGTWTIDFTSSSYTVTWNGKTVVHGDYTVNRADMNLTDKSGELKCPGTATYRFKAKGTKLTFEKIKDSKACPGRIAVLTTHPLTRVS